MSDDNGQTMRESEAVMRKFVVITTLLLGSATLAADTLVDRWAAAVGGREKVAAISSMYREATVEVRGLVGSIKAWRTADGKYRKEEQIATFSTVETFDGTKGSYQQGAAPPQAMSGPQLARARSTAFANSNAIFFAFFPERRRGTLAIEDNRIVLTPDGGIDWRVTLDPQTWLPKTMVHEEGERTVTVTFISYETIDGVTLEKEIHRSTGAGGVDSVIRFTKTVLNPPIDAPLFAIAPTQATGERDEFSRSQRRGDR
jgi:hypothetical protein